MFTKKIPTSFRARNTVDALIKISDEKLEKPLLDLPYSLFKLYETQGTRLEYEDVYTEHRLVTTAHFFAYLKTGEKSRLDALVDAVWAILNEFTWALPAHLSGRNAVEMVTGRLDLFCAETAVQLCYIDAVLGDELPIIVRERIRYETERRVINPFVTKAHEFGKSNWSAIQACGLTACYTLLFPEKFTDEVKNELIYIYEQFLLSYGDDGCCQEGPLYWIYGFGFFVYGASLLREKTGIDLFAREKVRKMAGYWDAISMPRGFVAAFSDSPITCKTKSGLALFLNREYGIPLPPEESLSKFGEDRRVRFADVFHDVFWDSDEKGIVKTEEKTVYYPDAQWFLRKGKEISVCAKGGHNDEPHNHNDVGSFILFDKNQVVISDLGWGEYDKAYFSDKRYENICASSKGHSVPLLAMEEQKFTNEKQKAEVIKVSDDEFSIDMAKAYGVEKFIRSFAIKDETLTVTDECKTSFTERLVTTLKPAVAGFSVIVGGFAVETTPNCEIIVTETEYRPRRLVGSIHLKEVEKAYLIDLIPLEKTDKIKLTLTKLK